MDDMQFGPAGEVSMYVIAVQPFMVQAHIGVIRCNFPENHARFLKLRLYVLPSFSPMIVRSLIW